jgi:riboflavin synthase
MFTGIVERIGTIIHSRPVAGGSCLRIDAGSLAGGCANGASVCVSGVCLTVADIDGTFLSFDVITETLNKSTLGAKRVGDGVNLELSLRVDGRLDGHFVQGHVDGRAVVDRVVASAAQHVIRLRPDSTLLPYIIPKGSIALDGVSLTIAEVTPTLFSVALIPTTLDRTTLAKLAVGDQVNVESDIIARTIVHQLDSMSGPSGLSMESLREGGFA